MIGEVPGTQKPEEVLLLGAHLDAWDLGDGAVDDAAGVGVVLEVASELVMRPLPRTVRVVLFANEENGLKDAGAYVDPGAAAAMQPLHKSLAELALTLAPDAEAGGADRRALRGDSRVRHPPAELPDPLASWLSPC